MGEPGLAPMAMDLQAISAAHAAAAQECEPWLRRMEAALAQTHAALGALQSMPVDERARYAAQVKSELEALLESARSFQGALEEAVRTLDGGASTEDAREKAGRRS